VLAAIGNGDDKPANWRVQTGKAPAKSLFWENVVECLAMVMTIGEDGAATRLRGWGIGKFMRELSSWDFISDAGQGKVIHAVDFPSVGHPDTGFTGLTENVSSQWPK
jgi:hypothetical protein